MSYTVTYAGITPTAISLEPASSVATSGTGTYSSSNSILLAGTYPSSITNQGSGTSTTPGSGTSTTPGSGTASSITSPVSGTASVSSSRADSLNRGLYRLNLRSIAYPNGEIGGIVQAR